MKLRIHSVVVGVISIRYMNIFVLLFQRQYTHYVVFFYNIFNEDKSQCTYFINRTYISLPLAIKQLQNKK